MNFIKQLWKRFKCKHTNISFYESEAFYVTTCNDCGKQRLERKIL